MYKDLFFKKNCNLRDCFRQELYKKLKKCTLDFVIQIICKGML